MLDLIVLKLVIHSKFHCSASNRISLIKRTLSFYFLTRNTKKILLIANSIKTPTLVFTHMVYSQSSLHVHYKTATSSFRFCLPAIETKPYYHRNMNHLQYVGFITLMWQKLYKLSDWYGNSDAGYSL